MQQNPNPARNGLAAESSLYLQQHATNPVNWWPWGEAIWRRARQEQRLVIVSIGYSTCHWCHVMERESFEDEGVADFMNAHFLSIKVDREERPDVDGIYMTAVQLMTRQGGWPLNVVCLPDGRPVWGGTYFPPERWVASLRAVLQAWRQDRPAFEAYAAKLAAGVQSASIVEIEGDAQTPPHADWLEERFADWRQHWDPKHGGNTGAPKFPMPPALRYLLTRAVRGSSTPAGAVADAGAGAGADAATHLATTLDAIAAGGIHDAVGGGFARYAVDEAWQVPHFEKMLYDNGQLLELYALGWLARPEKSLWKAAALGTADWLRQEMVRSVDGAFCAAMDADSRDASGVMVEGAFYVWPQSTELPEGFALAHHDDLPGGTLVRTATVVTPAAERRLAEMRRERAASRHAPAIDPKPLTDWNALAIKGLMAGYRAFGRAEDLAAARTALTATVLNSWRQHGIVERGTGNGEPGTGNGEPGTGNGPGFLTDWAFAASACRALYEGTFERVWAETGLAILEALLARFTSRDGVGLWLSPPGDDTLFTAQHDMEDDVMPSGTSEAAMNLWWFGTLFDRPDLLARCDALLQLAKTRVNWLPSGGQWAEVMHFRQPGATVEVGVLGGHSSEDLDQSRAQLQRLAGPTPGVVWFGGTSPETTVETPLTRGRFGQELRIFVCHGGTCRQPVTKLDNALHLLQTALTP